MLNSEYSNITKDLQTVNLNPHFKQTITYRNSHQRQHSKR